MKVVRSQSVLFDTREAADRLFDTWEVTVPSGMLRRAPTERFRLSLRWLQFFADAPNVHGQNNRVRFLNEETDTVHEVTIPPGCYTRCTLKAALESAYPLLHLTWLPHKHGWRMDFHSTALDGKTTPVQHSVQWLGTQSFALFGFRQDDSLIFNTSFTSTVPVQIDPYNCFRLYMNNSVSSMQYMSLETHGGTVRPESVLLHHPVSYAPFTWCRVEPQNPTHVWATDPDLLGLSLTARLYNEAGMSGATVPHFQCELLIECVDTARDIGRTEAALEELLLHSRYRLLGKGI